MKISLQSWHRGYVLLISTLFIGAIASAILTSVLMLGTNSGLVHFSVQQSARAVAAAEACAEIGLEALRNNPSYAGDETHTLDTGVTCEVLSIGGTGNTNRLLCTEGVVGDTTRRLEIVISSLYPQIRISSWQEVSTFSLCE
ncbi:MAG: hypothetical protein ABL890_02920 [Candidatus Peribacteraceae bacterium]